MIVGKTSEAIKTLMFYLADPCINFTNLQGKFPVPTDPNFLIRSMLNVFELLCERLEAGGREIAKGT